MLPPNDSDPLDSLLERLRHESPPSVPPVTRDVWRRIELAEQAQPAWRRWWSDAEAVLARPSFAAAFVIACILAGLLTAEIRVSHAADERNAELRQAYWRLVDPLLEAAPVATDDPTTRS